MPPVALPQEIVDSIEPAATLPKAQEKWLSNEQVVSILISFDNHPKWLVQSAPPQRPCSGSVLLINRKLVKYKKDGYSWKVRKDNCNTREDSVRLKIQSFEILKCMYTHSSIIPTFHRRSYFLLANPDIVLVHYLNAAPFDDANYPLFWPQSRFWTRDDLMLELIPIFRTLTSGDSCNGSEHLERIKSLAEKILLDQRRTSSSITVHPSTPSCGAVGNTQFHLKRRGDTGEAMSIDDEEISLVSKRDKLTRPRPIAVQQHPGPLSMVLNIQPIVTVTMTPGVSQESPTKPVYTDCATQTTEVSTATEFACPKIPLNGNVACNGSVDSPHLTPLSSNMDSPHLESCSLSSHLIESSFTASVESSTVNFYQSSQHSFNSCSISRSPTRSFADHIMDLNGSDPSQSPPEPVHHSTPSMTSKHNQGPTTAANPMFGSGFQSSPQDLNTRSSRSRSITSDLGFSEGLEVSPAVVSEPQPCNLFASNYTEANFLCNMGGSYSTTSSSTQQSIATNLSDADVSAGSIAMELPDLGNMNDFPDFLASPSPAAVFSPIQDLVYISEYSPAWSFEQGGEKVLLIGNWSNFESDVLSCQFGLKCVPAAVVTPGVLRCICPANEAGSVALSVLRNGSSLTHPVPFEYRPLPRREQSSSGGSGWLALDDSVFRSNLLSRLNEMQNRLDLCSNGSSPGGPTFDCAQELDCGFESTFDLKLVNFFRVLASRISNLAGVDQLRSMPRPDRGLTMLHLAAALGMPRLVDVMRGCSEHPAFSQDLNPTALDDQGCSPLTWACARGNLESALLLFNWSPEMLAQCNNDGLSPVMIARQRGHILLVETLCEQVPDVTGEGAGRPMETDSASTDGSESDSDMESLPSTPRSNFTGLTAMDEDLENEAPLEATAEPVSQPVRDMFHHNMSCVTTSLQVYNLAQQIIKAIPDRIKSEDCSFSQEVRDEFRCDVSGGWSRDDSHRRQSEIDRPESPMCMADLKEFISGGNVEAELNSLTLSDSDQRTLYESAKIIQSAFRQYKQCRQKRQQEIAAAILIQSYFRKYRQYFSYKRMCRAARLIQKVFRRYKYAGCGASAAGGGFDNRSLHAMKAAFSDGRTPLSTCASQPNDRPDRAIDHAVLIVQRSFRLKAKRKKENDAALKIQRFLRQCKHKIDTLRNVDSHPCMMQYFAH